MVRNAPAIVAKQISCASLPQVKFEIYEWNKTCLLICRQSRVRLAGDVSVNRLQVYLEKPKEL